MGKWFTRTRKHVAAIEQMEAEVERVTACLDTYDRQFGQVTIDVTADDRTVVVDFNQYGERFRRPAMTDVARDRVVAQAADDRDVSTDQIHWLGWSGAGSERATGEYVVRTSDDELYAIFAAVVESDDSSYELLSQTAELFTVVERATHDRGMVERARQLREAARALRGRSSRSCMDLRRHSHSYRWTSPLELLYGELYARNQQQQRRRRAEEQAAALPAPMAAALVDAIGQHSTAEALRDAVRDTVDVDRDTDTVVDRRTRRWIGRDADARTLVEVTDKVAAILNGDDETGSETRQTGFLRSIREAV